MLKLLNGSDNPILPIDDFYIDELWSGLDELVFDIQTADPACKSILMEAIVEHEQPYLVKAIDAGKTTSKIKCQLNLDDLKADMLIAYSNGSKTVADTIEEVAAPVGWSVVDHSYFTNRRTVELEGGTPLDVIQKCQDTYSVVIRYNPKLKQIHIWDPDAFVPLGAFAIRDLNLKEINYKGKSSDFATRLYGYGKDNLTVASINSGKAYVENRDYADKIISVYWKDERYTVVENLLADMKKKLKELAVPATSYSCSVLDLAKTNPELYGHQNFNLMQVIRLIDEERGLQVNHQVVQYRRYPHHPEKNVVTLSTVPPQIQSSMKQLQYNQDDPSSPFRQQMQAAITNATEKISLAEKGYVVLPKDADGNVTELLIMNAMSKETATKVWRWNLGGLGYSSTGYNGPYGTAMTMDGAIVADFITVGTVSCDRLRGGTLILGGASNGNGVFYLRDASNKNIALMDNTGLKMFKGSINLADNFIVSSEGVMNAKSGTFAGTLSAATGTFAGSLSAATGTFAGTLSAADGTFGGELLAARGTFAGSLTAATGTFKGSLEAATGTFAGSLSAATGSFSGSVTATSGYIGGSTGFVITTGKMYAGGKSSFAYNSNGVYVGTDGISLGPVSGGVSMFEVDSQGVSVVRKMYVVEQGILFEPGGGIGTDNSSHAQFQVLSNGADVVVNSVSDKLFLGAFDTNEVRVGATLYDNNGGVISSSDKRLKKSIRSLNKKSSYDFVMSLNPAKYKLRNGTSDRYHHGFIAQDVKEAMRSDWGLFVEFDYYKTPTAKPVKRYALRYGEMLADIVAALQYMDERMDELYGKAGQKRKAG